MTTYVLVPGAGGSAWYWHLVERELQRRGHVALAVELPAQDSTKGLYEYADAVVRAGQGLGDVVLVAQSMGAFSAPLVVGRLPVLAIVLLCPMTPKPRESLAEWWEATGQAEAQLEGDAFLHDLPEDVLAQMADHDKDQSAGPWKELWPLDAWPEVPTAALVGVDDRLFPLDFQRRVIGERLGLDVVHVPGGHLAALSHPDAVTDAIVACVNDLVLG